MKKSMGILLSLLLALSISDAGVAEKKNAFDFCDDFSARLALLQTVILETPDIGHSEQEYAIAPLTDYSSEKERYLCKLPAANIIVSMPNFEIEEASCLILELDTPQSETTAAVSGSAMVYSALEYGNSPNSVALIHQTYNEFTSAVSKCIKSADNREILGKENGTRISFLSGNYAYSLYTNRVNENGKTKHCLFMEATANPARTSRSETGLKQTTTKEITHPTSVSQTETGLKQTTTKEIRFMDIPWESSFAQFLALLQDDGAVFTVNKEISGVGDDYSSSFGIGNLIPSGNYKGFPTEFYTLKSDDAPFYVAGYKIGNMYAHFYKEAQTMYDVSICLESSTRTGDIIPSESQYHDLVSKLTKLYGKPIVQEWSGVGSFIHGGTFETHSCSWIGANSTAVELRWIYREGTSQGIFDGDEITLNYGKTDSNSIMEEHQRKAEEQEKKLQQKALDSINDDYSGL